MTKRTKKATALRNGYNMGLQSKNKSIVFRVTEAEHAMMEREARMRGFTMSSLIREGVNHVLDAVTPHNRNA